MADKLIRVLRLLEYTYDSVEIMAEDMAHWQVQGLFRPNPRCLIKSAVLPLTVLKVDEPGD